LKKKVKGTEISNKADVRMSVLLEKDYSFLDDDQVGSMQNFNQNFEANFFSERGKKMGGAEKQEFEFKLKFLGEELDTLRLENEALAKGGSGPEDRAEMDRLRRDVEKQELKNVILEKGNIGLIKGNIFFWLV
jgi:hypothetical protein